MANPFAPAGELPLVRGRARDFLIQIANTDGTPAAGVFLDSDVLTASLWPGGGQAGVAYPTAAWQQPGGSSAGQTVVSFAAADTAGLAAGTYTLQVDVTRGGKTGTVARFSLALLDAPGTSTGNAFDLVTYAQAQAALAEALPDDQTYLPQAITAASRMVRRYCRRDFVQATYDELYNGLGYSSFFLRQYPVSTVLELSTNPQDALTVKNAGNPVATASLTVTGDDDTGLTATGLTLYWEDPSGVAHTDTSVSFATATTLAAAASAVGAVGSGWSASAASPWTARRTAGIRPAQGAFDATGTGGGASFQVFTQGVSGYTLNSKTGEIRLNNQTYDPIFALMNLNASSTLTVFVPGYQNVRARYTAGYATVPQDVQAAVLLTAKSLVLSSQLDTRFKSEKLDQWSATLADRATGLPPEARLILDTGGWVSRRSY